MWIWKRHNGEAWSHHLHLLQNAVQAVLRICWIRSHSAHYKGTLYSAPLRGHGGPNCWATASGAVWRCLTRQSWAERAVLDSLTFVSSKVKEMAGIYLQQWPPPESDWNSEVAEFQKSHGCHLNQIPDGQEGKGGHWDASATGSYPFQYLKF